MRQALLAVSLSVHCILTTASNVVLPVSNGKIALPEEEQKHSAAGSEVKRKKFSKKESRSEHFALKYF